MKTTIAFFMPEFPGHSHTWLWREICGLRECGLTVHLASTRPPKPHDKAKHAFATAADCKVFYTWPPKPLNLLSFAAWSVSNPRRVANCISYARALKRDGGKSIHHNLALMLPAWRLVCWCRKHGIRHIHVATPANSIIIAQLACIMADFSCDTTINAKLEWWGGAMHEKLSRCSSVFPVAEWMRDQIAHKYPDILSRTVVARHGVDIETWYPPTHLPDDDGLFQITSVGRLHPAKGHDDLLRALRILLDRGRDVQLHIVGGGSDYDRLSQLIQELDIADHADLTGPLHESGVRAILETSNIFVLASHAEALGVVFMEAMAMKLPVIATRTDGAQEIVENGVTGILVNIKNPDEIANAIESLLDDPEQRSSMATNGLKRVREQFDSRVGAQIVARQIVLSLEARDEPLEVH